MAATKPPTPPAFSFRTTGDRTEIRSRPRKLRAQVQTLWERYRKLLAEALSHQAAIRNRPQTSAWDRRKVQVLCESGLPRSVAESLIAQDYDVSWPRTWSGFGTQGRKDGCDRLDASFDPLEQGVAFIPASALVTSFGRASVLCLRNVRHSHDGFACGVSSRHLIL